MARKKVSAEAPPIAVPDDPRDLVPVARAESPSLELFRAAIEKGVDLEQLYRLHVEERSYNARIAFNDALSQFQQECPPIPRTSTGGKGSYSFKYADYEQIVETVRPHLHANGFSYSFDSTVTKDGNLICTCNLRHAAGHSESASFTTPTESPSPGMGAQHRVASALKVAQRHALLSILGLPATDTVPEEGETRAAAAKGVRAAAEGKAAPPDDYRKALSGELERLGYMTVPDKLKAMSAMATFLAQKEVVFTKVDQVTNERAKKLYEHAKKIEVAKKSPRKQTSKAEVVDEEPPVEDLASDDVPPLEGEEDETEPAPEEPESEDAYSLLALLTLIKTARKVLGRSFIKDVEANGTTYFVDQATMKKLGHPQAVPLQQKQDDGTRRQIAQKATIARIMDALQEELDEKVEAS